LLDRQNYQLFQPLLYQVATAALSPADIAEPVRKMLRGYPIVKILLGEAVKIDTTARSVSLADGKILAYDYLVVATGATHAYFGHDEWAEFAPSLKSLSDARKIRSRLLRSFELAEMEDDAAERQRLMTFVVVGGGPSGVELAGAVAELARYTLSRDFHRIDAKSAKIVLMEAGLRILADFPDELAHYAHRKLTSLGLTVQTGSAVKNISQNGVDT
jgi:NADH dehydrogenase